MGLRLRFLSLMPTLLLSWQPCSGQTGQAPDVFACFVHLQLPQYPALARAAQVQGVVVASFTVGTMGDAQQLVISAPNGELRRLVERHLSLSKFKEACTGKKLTLRVKFILEEPRTSYGSSQLALVAPDAVEITTTLPELSEPQPASPTP